MKRLNQKTMLLIFLVLMVNSFDYDNSESSVSEKILKKNTFQIHRHDFSTNARCLDGSPSAIYIYQGQDKNRFIVYMEGGVFCFGLSKAAALKNCVERSKTLYGSSKEYPQSNDFSRHSLLSNDPVRNPNFYKWSKVYIPYCDGSGHLGRVKDPIVVDSTELYFRGYDNTVNHFKYLNEKFNFFKSKNIVLTGASAGGVAAMYWSNYLYDSLTYPKGLLILPEAAIFVNEFVQPQIKLPLLEIGLSILDSIVNVEANFPLVQCTQELKQNIKCLNFKNLVKYVKAPIFAIQSLYDTFALQNILLSKCQNKGGIFRPPVSLDNCSEAELLLIESYRKSLLENIGILTQYEKNGVWAISCGFHFLSVLGKTTLSNQNYSVQGSCGPVNVNQAISDFINRTGDKVNIDAVAWPNNTKCNGIHNEISLQCPDGRCTVCQFGYYLLDILKCEIKENPISSIRTNQ